MTQPPFGPDPNRPQDTPRSFPTYGRPQEAPQSQPPAYGQQQSPYQRPQDTPPSYSQPQYSPQQQPPAYGQQPPPYSPQPPQYGPQYGQPPPYGPHVPHFGPYVGGYGYGYPGSPFQRTNSLATAALVTGLVGIVFGFAGPVAVGLGIAALVQLKRRNESGTAQAVIGLILGSLQVLFWGMILIIAIASGGDEDYSSGPSPTYDPNGTYIIDLAVGECFDDVADPDEVERVPCAEPHDGELTSNVTLPDEPYSENRVERAAEAACDREFGKYVGNSVDRSELRSEFWWPDEGSWEEGDRIVVCAAYGPGGDKLTGTVKDSKR